MCGIVGYTGKREAYDVLIEGLYQLEYRGYDSAGIALEQNNKISLYKCKGKVSDLDQKCKTKNTSGFVGIAHTRWATHGEPNDENAHPHLSENHKIALIHNGIIENYNTLKKELINRGYIFKSQTDTEVLVYLIQDVFEKAKVSFEEAVKIALSSVEGTYALGILFSDNPSDLIVAKKGSPLLIGIGKNEYFIASDGAPIIKYTNKVIYLNDGDIAVLNPNKDMLITNINREKTIPYVQKLEITLAQLEKGTFPHYMLKEIYEQPRAIKDSMRGRISSAQDVVSLGGMIEYENKLIETKRFIIIACGTSWHASLVGKYLIENLTRVPCEVAYASEFRYNNPIITENDVVIAISQSGETADTLAAINIAKDKGAIVLGICNVVGSAMSRETHAGSYTHAGAEIGVASTKAFTTQIAVLTLMALNLAHKKGTIARSYYHKLITALEAIPEKIETVLSHNDKIAQIADYFVNKTNAIYLGRGINFPVALEGALKLKEISYIHAEGYPAAEMKHGPIALIDEDMPVIVLATHQKTYDKIISNIQEIIARKGKIIAIVTEGDLRVEEFAEYTIEVPETEELLLPILSVIPLQLLAYHVAVKRNCDVDKPRNLAKSVSVE